MVLLVLFILAIILVLAGTVDIEEYKKLFKGEDNDSTNH